MSNTNSKDLRAALARAIKFHCEANGLNGVSGGKLAGIANSRMSQILRGDVEKISSDALVDIAGSLGYRLTSVIGSNDGHEFALVSVTHVSDLREELGLSVDEKYEIGELAMNESGDIVLVDEADPDADRVISDE